MEDLILGIDIGNTRTKAALFNNREIVEYFADFTIEQLNNLSANIKACLVSKSGSNPALEKELELRSLYNLLSHKTPLPITLDYKTPETLGLDRIAAAVGAAHLYANKNVVIIDSGTCLTIDWIDQKKVFRGGLISPGLQMRLDAMHQFTAGLPKVEIDLNLKYPGKSTKESMQIGAYRSMVYEIKGHLDSLTEQLGQIIVVDCSGFNFNFESVLNYQIFAHPKLVLQGLNEIAHYNA